MNKHDAKYFLPLVQALAEGKTIQVFGDCDNSWEDVHELLFSGSPASYRIKPEPIEYWLAIKDGGDVHAFSKRRESVEIYDHCRIVHLREVTDEEQ